jgi:threonine dehydrogenase-like Zn-dependent dehydrogenase
VLKGLHLVGAFSTSYWAHEQAIRVLADPRQRYPFDKLSTHTVPLERAEEGIRMLGGELEQSAIHVTIAPWA